MLALFTLALALLGVAIVGVSLYGLQHLFDSSFKVVALHVGALGFGLWYVGYFFYHTSQMIGPAAWPLAVGISFVFVLFALPPLWRWIKDKLTI